MKSHRITANKYHFLAKIVALTMLPSVYFSSQASTTPTISPSSATTVTRVVMHCPSPQQLVLDNLLWTAPEGWVSYNESFDKSIARFEKAQWQGVNIGKIFCIYQSGNPLSFPIVLEQQRDKLVPEPKNGQWGNNQGGYKDCTSSRIEDCPFEISKTAETVDPYQEIDFFKKQKHN